MFLPGSLFGQGEANNWYFGYYAGLDFSSGTPVPINNSALYNSEGSASISDAAGTLQFYTNGTTVWNRNNIPMTNGTNLFGHSSSTQSALIVSMPGSNHLYYIFTTDQMATGGIKGTYYSIVDMNLNGGTGDVILKNQLLVPASNATEKITAVKHANNTDVWILTHGWNNNQYLTFLLTSSGINTTPIFSYAGLVLGPNTLHRAGYLKTSPNGQYLANALYDYGAQAKVELLSFDPCNGTVYSNTDSFNDTVNYCYGVEFSPDNSKLYCSGTSEQGTIWQYDLSSGNQYTIKSSRTSIASSSGGFNALQIGPDQKIYASGGGSNTISVIKNPNAAALECQFEYASISLGNGSCRFGLPNFIQSYFNFFEAGTSDNTLCTGDSLILFCTSVSGATYSWTGPDGFTSTLANPVIPFADTSNSGMYTVTYSLSGCPGSTASVFVSVSPPPSAPSVPPDFAVCNGNSVTLSAGGPNGYDYYWQGPNGFIAYTQNVTFPDVTSSDTGFYVISSFFNGCESTPSILHLTTGTATGYAWGDSLICVNDSAYLHTSSGEFFDWFPTASLLLTDPAHPVAFPAFTTLYTVDLYTAHGNMVRNSSFDGGNTGFYSNFSPNNSPLSDGTYCVTPFPATANPAWNACSDHTTGSGPMMCVNNSSTAGETLWKETIRVSPFTDYMFRFWTAVLNSGSSPSLALRINGSTSASSVAFNSSTCVWSQNKYRLNSGSADTMVIEIINQTSGAGSADFAFDDMELAILCMSTDSIRVQVVQPPPVNLGVDTTLCNTAELTLNAGNQPGQTYVWSTGENTSHITVMNDGTYSVTVSNNICTASDSISLEFINIPERLGNDTVLCSSPYLLEIPYTPGNTYLWSTGDTGVFLPVYASGIYSITVTHDNCSIQDSIQLGIITINANLGNDTLLCNTEFFIISPDQPGTDYLWSDGTDQPQLTVSQTGMYSVTVSNDVCSDTDTVEIIFHDIIHDITGDTVLCRGDTIQLGTFFNPEYIYSWSTGDTSSQITVFTEGLYWVEIHDAYCSIKDSAFVYRNNYPQVELGIDTFLCHSSAMVLDAGQPGFTYAWSTGENTESIIADRSGFYAVTVTDGICTESDSIQIYIATPPELRDLYSLCAEDEIHLTAGKAPGSYLWSTGESGPTLTVTEPGEYWVVHSEGECIYQDTTVVEGSPSTLFAPNSITPNGDGLNDVFYIYGTEILNPVIRVFNRWGEQIFESFSLEAGWDGKFKGSLLPPDVYVWILDYQKPCSHSSWHRKEGVINIVR